MRQHKQFKIGEYAIGGIIDVTICNNEIVIKALDWDTKDVILSKTFDSKGMDSDYAILEWTNELTSSYYSDEVFNYIKQFVQFEVNW